MFDFGSAHRNEGDVLGVNTKGLVSFDRQTRKDAFYFYKANWSSEPVTYITSRRYVDRAYPVADVKVYSNADSVELMVNGTSVGSMSAGLCPQRVCLFKNVPLTLGQNTLTALGNHAGTPLGDTVEWTLNGTNVNIAAGRLVTGYVSSQGTHFGSDNFFWGGTKDTIGPEERGGDPEVKGTNDPQLYKYYRRGDFSYDVPLPDGRYALTLGFLEPESGTKEGARVFNVIASGQPLLENFDVRKAAGASKRVVTRTFTLDVSGGRLVIAFNPLKGEAVVSTIKVTRQ
jgi:beta-galactosidase